MQFFPGVTCALDLIHEQIALLEFISIYESIEEMDPRDRPESSTVENDADFDRWVQDYIQRKEAEIISGEKQTASKHKNVVRFHPDEGSEQLDD